MTIVDASVAIKWFVPSEPLRDDAIKVLHAIADAPDEYAVPELFFNEMLSVLCKLEDISAQNVIAHLTRLEDLGLRRIGNGHDLLALAAKRAREWGLSGYDAIYVACAELTRGHWLTADNRARKRVPKERLVRLL